MKKFLLILVVCSCLGACSGIKKYNEQITIKHDVSSLRSDVDYTYKKLQRFHPKLYQYIDKATLDEKFESLRQRINSPLTSREFYDQLVPVIFSIKQGHIGLGPPSKKLTKKERKPYTKTKFEFAQVQFEVLQKKLWIKAVYGNDTTLVGSQVIRVDDQPFDKLLVRFKQQFSSDGYNATFYDRFVGERFAQMYTRSQGILDSVQLSLQKNDSTFSKMLRRIPKDSIFYGKSKKNIKGKDSIKKKRPKVSKVERDKLKSAQKKQRKFNKIHGHLKGDLYTRNFKIMDSLSQIAYIKIRHFGNGKYKKFYANSFAKIDSLKANTLILDLRDNPGGRLDEIDKLYSYLSLTDYQLINKGELLTRTPLLTSILSKNKPFLLRFLAVALAPIIAPIELMYNSKVNGKRYYALSSSKKKSPDELNFKGRLYVLINGNSFSASSIISTNLQATKRATFVGEETGGAYNGTVAGLMKFIELPTSKVRMNFGLIQIESPYKTEVDGFGVYPDVIIIPTPADRKRGIDPELDYVLNEINANNSAKE